MARLKKDTHNAEIVEKLARLGLTYRSIADYCMVSSSTIETNYAALIKRCHAELGSRLRQRLVERAVHEDDKQCQMYLDKRLVKDDDSPGGITQVDPITRISLHRISKA